ncbi:MAG: hypothetical protein JXE07_01095 [Candidatus Aminicenantes bacterium]|nr:hypothetical protein [Candidatus Aminicenantes bacterium]
MRPVNVNLATRPLRNSRLFFLLGGGAGLVFLITSLAAVIVFFQFSLKKSAAGTALQEVEASMRKAETNQKRVANRVKEAADKDQDVIDTINGIILKKSLSWTDFLSQLEECLPESSYILSLSIPQVDSARIQLRIRVVSRNLDDLLALINKLQDLNFSRPRVETEERNEQGQLVSDISVTYERTV